MNEVPRLRVLVVDDEAIVRKTLADFLADAGWDVDVAESGERALELTAQNDYHAAVLDLQMPGMDGFSLLVNLRKRWPKLPIILMTGHGAVELEERALANGAARFLHKPIKLIELDDILAEIRGRGK